MKKRLFQKILAAALCIAMTVCLAACGKDGGSGASGGTGSSGGSIFGGGSGSSSSSGGTVAVDPELAKQHVYHSTSINMGSLGDYSYIKGSVASDDGLYLLMEIDEYGENYKEYSRLYHIGKDGVIIGSNDLVTPEFEAYEGYDPDNENSYLSSYLSTVQLSSEGYVYGIYNYSYSDYSDWDNYIYESTYYLCKWDGTGNLVDTINLTEYLSADNSYVNNMFVTSDGGIFLISTSDWENYTAIVLDANGKVSTKSLSGTQISNLSYCIAMDGKNYVVYSDTENDWKSMIGILDLNSLAISGAVELPATLAYAGYNSISRGINKQFVATNTNGVYAFNYGDTDCELVMDYINSDLNGNYISNAVFLDDKTFLGSYYDLDYNTQFGLFRYVDPSEIADRKTLALACYYLDSDVRSQVLNFNSTNEEYRIMVTQYSNFSTEDDYMAGYTQLNNDILAGKIPDILIGYGDSIDINNYVKKGLFADVEALIAADPELSGNKYLSNVFDAMRIDGKVCYFTPSFYFSTVLAKKSLASQCGNMTVADAVALLKAYPDASLFSETTRSEFLNNALNYCMNSFVNPDTKLCNFDSDAFVSLLELANRFPETIDWDSLYADDNYWTYYQDRFRNNSVLLMQSGISSMSDFQYSNYSNFGEAGVITGFPSAEGGVSALSIYNIIAVSAVSANQQGAWDFAKQYLTEDYQDAVEYNIPILESSFEKWLAKGKEKPTYLGSDGNYVEYDNYYYYNDEEVVIPVMTDAEIDAVRKAITGCTNVSRTDSDLTAIIEEETGAFFSGQKTAKEVAGIIQSRIQLYVNENS